MDERIEAVQRMQDYIAAHFSETITPADLARVSLFSPWYAHRLFTRLTGLTPADYIRRMRLTASALKLRDEGCTVTDAAFSCGFGSVDGYQRAFLRTFQCNPHLYAAKPIPLYLFTPYSVKSRVAGKESRMEKTKNIFIQLVEKPARKVVLKRGVTAADYWTYCNEVGCDVWGLLRSMKSLCGEPVCLWLPAQYRKPGTSEYVQGVEVPEDYAGPVPEGFDVISLPAAQYLMFQGESFAEENYQEAIGQVWDAIDKYHPATVGYEWDAENPRIQLEPVGSRGYVELRAVRPIR